MGYDASGSGVQSGWGAELSPVADGALQGALSTLGDAAVFSCALLVASAVSLLCSLTVMQSHWEMLILQP